jgi:hypothetical protein
MPGAARFRDHWLGNVASVRSDAVNVRIRAMRLRGVVPRRAVARRALILTLGAAGCTGIGLGAASSVVAVGPTQGASPARSATVPPDTSVPDTASTEDGGVVPEDVGAQTGVVPDDTIAVGDPGALIPIPSGCVSPPVATAVFVGSLVARASNEARFEVEQIKAGSLEGYAFGAIVDVRYEENVYYTLEVGTSYLVGAAPDGSGKLASKVREPKPLFGGDGVIGANDNDVQCPEIEDPLRTINADGSEIDVGLLTPLSRNKAVLLSAIARPVVIGFGVLLLLTAIKMLAAATIRALRSGGVTESPPPASQRVQRRERRHALAMESASGRDGQTAQFVDGVGEPERIAIQGAAGDQHVGAG